MLRTRRHRRLLHGWWFRTHYVAQRFWRLCAVLRHPTAPQFERDTGRSVPDCGELRHHEVGEAVDDLGVVEEVGLNVTDIKAYRGAGHGFANKLPGQPLLRITGFGYNRAAADDAWSRVFAFFGEHLGATA